MSMLAEVQEKERRIRRVLSDLGYDLLIVTRRDNLAWLSCGGREVALELATGRVAADGPLPGADDIGEEVVALHEPYTPQEMERYRALGAESGEILHELAEWVEPGMTERQVFAPMWGLYLAHGFEGDCMFVAADDRIRQERGTDLGGRGGSSDQVGGSRVAHA